MNKSLKKVKYTYQIVTFLLSVYGGFILNDYLKRKSITEGKSLPELYLFIISGLAGYLGFHTTKATERLSRNKSFTEVERFHAKAVAGLMTFFYSMIYILIALYIFYNYL